MKDLDPKSLLIGVLATALLFACADADKTSPSIVSEAKAATSPTDKWDVNQRWVVTRQDSGNNLVTALGFEPFNAQGNSIWLRKRIK